MGNDSAASTVPYRSRKLTVSRVLKVTQFWEDCQACGSKEDVVSFRAASSVMRLCDACFFYILKEMLRLGACWPRSSEAEDEARRDRLEEAKEEGRRQAEDAMVAAAQTADEARLARLGGPR